jgi:hypothetical protein
MSELQAGGLALIIGAVRLPETIGKIVTLVASSHSPDEGCDLWYVYGIEPCLFVRAHHLLPIKPEADPLDVTHKEELHA